MWSSISHFQIFTSKFTPEECNRIIALHRSTKARPIVVAGLKPGEPGRDCTVFWLSRVPDTAWIFDRIKFFVNIYNEAFGFKLVEQPDCLQLTRYGPGQCYQWHMDIGPREMSLRKISSTVELAAGGYSGGKLELFFGAVGGRFSLGLGDVIVFPSFVMHRVLPIESGVRWSLVSWMSGKEPFR
jgi:PKHD-type hydroxylase